MNIVTIFSCTKSLEIDIPQHPQKPDVSCFFTQDSTFKMQLSKSVGILDDFANPIDDAEILLYKNAILSDSLAYNGYEYESKVLAAVGEKYTFEAKLKGFNSISSTNIIPDKAILGDCTISDSNIWLDEEDLLNQKVQVSIQDEDPGDNYYEIFLFGKYIDNWSQEKVTRIIFPYSDDAVIEEEALNSVYPETLVFSDKFFNNSGIKLNIYYKQPNLNYGNGNITYLDYSLIVVVRSITKEYYIYTKKLYLHLWNQENDIWYGLGEPVQMYTNIENGYGIFIGYNEIRKEVFPPK